MNSVPWHRATGSRTKRPRNRRKRCITRTTEIIHGHGRCRGHFPRSDRRGPTGRDRRISRSNEPATAGGQPTAHGPKMEGAKKGRHGGDEKCRPSASDSQLRRPHTRTYPGAPHTSPRRTQRRPTESTRIWDEDQPPDDERDNTEPLRLLSPGPPPLRREAQQSSVRDIPLPPTARPATTTDGPEKEATGDNDRARKPAANRLETYARQGASVESFIAKFESHAKYYKWSEQDRVFQLKNSLTRTAAQALWTGGENATSSELIKLLHSRHGSKLQTERWWLELRARRRQPNEPLQAVCQAVCHDDSCT